MDKNKCRVPEKAIIPPIAAQHFVSTQHKVEQIEATSSSSEMAAKSSKKTWQQVFAARKLNKKSSVPRCALTELF